MAEMKKELMKNFRSELRVKDEEITGLKTQVSKLEKMVRSKNAELEGRDFRLFLIENSNHDRWVNDLEDSTIQSAKARC